MLYSVFIACVLAYSVAGHHVVYAPPPGYYCYLQCLNKCLATPPNTKTDDLLEFCKTEICWPMTADESYCDPANRTCFAGFCKPSDVGWVVDKVAEPVKSPNVTSRRRYGERTLWRLQWREVPGAIFYAVFHWQDEGDYSKFHHQEVREAWYQFPMKECKQHSARVAAISSTGMSPFSDVAKAYPVWNESEEVVMKLKMKAPAVVPLPYFYDPLAPTSANLPRGPLENSTLVLTIGYNLETAGWTNRDVLDLIDYAFLPVSCPLNDTRLDLTSVKVKTVSGRNEFVLNLPASMAEGKCKFLFSVKSFVAPCGRTVRVVHTPPGAEKGNDYGLWDTIDCSTIEGAICQDDHDVASSPSPRREERLPPQEVEHPHAFSFIPTHRVKAISNFWKLNPVPYSVILLAVLLATPMILFCIIRRFLVRNRDDKAASNA